MNTLLKLCGLMLFTILSTLAVWCAIEWINHPSIALALFTILTAFAAHSIYSDDINKRGV